MMKNTNIKIAYFTTCSELEKERNPTDPCAIPDEDMTLSHVDDFLQKLRLDHGNTASIELVVTNDTVPLTSYLHKATQQKHIPVLEVVPGLHEAKADYEQRLLRQLHEHDIDVILADSYMKIFGKTFLGIDTDSLTPEAETFSFGGLSVNLHPALTQELPGATPTADALLRARTGKSSGLEAETFLKTGATLHEIDLGIDTGPVIYQEVATPIRNTDTEQSLRKRNYHCKNKVALKGLEIYLNRPLTLTRINLHRHSHLISALV